MYFDITAYIHAKGMYYCVSRYLYMGYEVLEYVPGSPITRYVRYPDSLVPNTYATPPVTGYLERLLPGMPITQYILAPSNSVLYPHQRLPNMDYHPSVQKATQHTQTPLPHFPPLKFRTLPTSTITQHGLSPLCPWQQKP